MVVKQFALDINKREELVQLLREAAITISHYGYDSIFSSTDTAKNLGEIIEVAAMRLASGDDSDLFMLWNIFAPTCDWDDSGGSIELGNQIFYILNSLYLKE